MRFRVLWVSSIAVYSFAAVAVAQHSDIMIGEFAGKIVYEQSSIGRVFDGNFSTEGVFEQRTGNPGFSTNAVEDFLFPPSTVVDYNVLGPLAYHNGSEFAPVPADASITIEDIPDGVLTVDASTAGPVTGPGFIAQANSSVGGLHQHISFQLDPLSLDSPEYGAYGLLMELTTHVDSPVGLSNSDPFYLVFNFGLDDSQFDDALGAFATQVPEPASYGLVGLAAVAFAWLRRRFS